MNHTQITQWLFNASRVPEPFGHKDAEPMPAGRAPRPVEYLGRRYGSIKALSREIGKHHATVHGWIKQGIVKRLEEA